MLDILGPAAAGIVALAFLPAAQAHNALWSPSMWGFNDPQASWPLGGMSFDQWWFHGNLNDPPTETMPIPAGQTLTVELACRKTYSTWGTKPDADACPQDSGAYHAGGTTDDPTGWEGNTEDMLLGCALAIAYKSDVGDVQPEDFTVMSIQPECVRRRDTEFEIPANLPACPEGGCICAWFWSGKNSAMEMYMTGFKCDVQGGVATTEYPKPAVPRKGQVGSGPTQPYYWSNDRSNLDYTPVFENKPTYNSEWGYQAGAQTSAFSGLSSGGDSPAPAPGPSVSASPAPAPGPDGEGPTASDDPSPIPTSISGNDDDDDEEQSEPVTRPTSIAGGGGGGASRTGGGGGGGWTRTKTRNRPTWYNHAAAPTGVSGSDGADEASESAVAPEFEGGDEAVVGGGDEMEGGDAGEDGPAACQRSKKRKRRLSYH